jgi:hypothetical protein
MLISTKYYINNIGIVVIFIIFIGALSFLNFNAKNNTIPTKKTHLQNGDLVLRCGRSIESYAVYLADKEPEYSHIGIIVVEHSIPYVIHAVPNKTNLILKEQLSTFLNAKNCSKYAIYRANLNPNKLNIIATEAQNFYLSKYTFDNAYDLATNQELYCSELVLNAFLNAGINIKIPAKELNLVVTKRSIIFPSEFTKHPLFKRIIY